jgi:hypothetical protein
LSEQCGSLFFLCSFFLVCMAASWYYSSPFRACPLFHHLASCLLSSVSLYFPLLRMCLLSVSLLFLCHLCLLGVRILGSEQQLLWHFRRFILIFFSLYDCNLVATRWGMPMRGGPRCMIIRLGSDQVGDA